MILLADVVTIGLGPRLPGWMDRKRAESAEDEVRAMGEGGFILAALWRNVCTARSKCKGRHDRRTKAAGPEESFKVTSTRCFRGLLATAHT